MTSVSDRLQTERNIWLATARADQRPHLTPVWFVWVDESFWIGTGTGSVKARNVASNPLVALSLEDGDHPVVVEGTATLLAEERPAAVVDAFAHKYGWDITVAEDPDVGTVVLWRVEPLRWLFEAP